MFKHHLMSSACGIFKNVCQNGWNGREGERWILSDFLMTVLHSELHS
jgi:hypothetical protein